MRYSTTDELVLPVLVIIKSEKQYQMQKHYFDINYHQRAWVLVILRMQGFR